jgi:DNA-3-methyladenine glycosylase II
MDSKIRAHFQETDPILYKLLGRVGESNIKLSSRLPSRYFRALCSDIISQQLSGKVADVFWERFLKLFPQKRLTPTQVLALPDTTLRSIGISNSKVAFLKSLADHFVNHRINFSHLPNLSEEEVISELTKVKGIGRWTAEMFLMFTLGRPDVFSAGDQGLKNAIARHYPSSPPNPQIWSPYRTYACLILWRSLEL